MKDDYIKNVTYEELLVLKNDNWLEPEAYYKITNYITTSSQPHTKVSQHKFDIIVKAASPNKLYEEAKICHHQGDHYYDDCNLDAWKVWYCIDNDTNRFEWADKQHGKGVIYRMIDEYRNDCPYDFTNILFERDIEWIKEHSDWCEFVLGFIPKDPLYFYTFSWITNDMQTYDSSIISRKLKNDFGGITGVHDNKIYGCDNPLSSTIYKLNNNIFVSSQYWSNDKFYGIFANKIAPNCQNNTFGNECTGNSLSDNCSDNIFGNHCTCNKLLSECCFNLLKTSSCSNQLDHGCSYLYLSNSNYNHFGAGCFRIKSNVPMNHNDFGPYCHDINCGNYQLKTTRMFNFNIFQGNIKYVNITATKAHSKGYLQNVMVCQGVCGRADDYLNIVIPQINQDYQIKVGNNSKGDLRIYCEVDLLPE